MTINLNASQLKALVQEAISNKPRANVHLFNAAQLVAERAVDSVEMQGLIQRAAGSKSAKLRGDLLDAIFDAIVTTLRQESNVSR